MDAQGPRNAGQLDAESHGLGGEGHGSAAAGRRKSEEFHRNRRQGLHVFQPDVRRSSGGQEENPARAAAGARLPAYAEAVQRDPDSCAELQRNRFRRIPVQCDPGLVDGDDRRLGRVHQRQGQRPYQGDSGCMGNVPAFAGERLRPERPSAKRLVRGRRQKSAAEFRRRVRLRSVEAALRLQLMGSLLRA